MSDVLLLVVEDEILLHEPLECALGEAGFKTVFVCDGTAAIELLDEDAARFQGVLTDIKLGAGPDGWAVGHRARERVADMAVVYVSGDSGAEWSSKGVPNSFMIQKPFVSAQIITAMSQLLTARGTGGRPS